MQLVDLEDVGGNEDTDETVTTMVMANSHGISIRFHGYEDASGGENVLIQIEDGVPKVIIWADVNKHDPTHIISLEGAAKSKRTPGT